MLQHRPWEILRCKAPPLWLTAQYLLTGYLKAGTYCVIGGCCENGKVCTGGSGSSIFSSGDEDDDNDGLDGLLKPTKTSGSSGSESTSIIQGSKNMGVALSNPLGLMVAVAVFALGPLLFGA